MVKEKFPGESGEKDPRKELDIMQGEMRRAVHEEGDALKRLEIQRNLYAMWGLKMLVEKGESLEAIRARLRKDLEWRKKNQKERKETDTDYIRRELSLLEELERRSA